MLKKRILEFFKPKKSLKYIKQARLKGYAWLRNNQSENEINDGAGGSNADLAQPLASAASPKNAATTIRRALRNPSLIM